MKISAKLIVLAAVPLIIASIAFRLASDTGSIEGLIQDADGPVAGASIDARHLVRGQAWHTKSGKDGSYKIQGLERGDYSFWIQAAEHESAWIPRVFIEREVVNHQDFLLHKKRSATTARVGQNLAGGGGV